MEQDGPAKIVERFQGLQPRRQEAGSSLPTLHATNLESHSIEAN
jgi:hypothetical protein